MAVPLNAGALKQCKLLRRPTRLCYQEGPSPAFGPGHPAHGGPLAAAQVRGCGSSRLSAVRARAQADRFHQTGRQLRSKMWWQNMKLKVG